MVEIGTKIELANISGKSQMNPATCAVSGFLTDKPIVAETQEKTKPKSNAIRIPKRKSPKGASVSNPIR